MIRRQNPSDHPTMFQTVLRSEMTHLKRSLGGKRGRLQRSFIWIMVLIALSSFGWRVINTIPQYPSTLYWLLSHSADFNRINYYDTGGLHDILFHVLLLFPICVLLWDFWLMFQTLLISTNGVVREQAGTNWELLLLADTNVWQIIRAKWWAIFRHQWRDYALLAIMRIGAVSFLALNFSVDFTFGRFPYFSYGSAGPLDEPQRTTIFLVSIFIVILSAVLIGVLTLVNLAFTAACGIVGGCITRRRLPALLCGIGIRLLLVGIFAALVGMPGYLGIKPDIDTSGYYPDPVFSTISLILCLTGVTMLDMGSIAAGLLMRFGYYFRWQLLYGGFVFFSDTLRGHGPAFLTALLLSIVLYTAFTYIILRQGERLISRQHS